MVTAVPDVIYAGVDTVISVVSDGVSVTMVANCAGTVITLTGVDQGDGTFSCTFPDTTKYEGGRYDYIVWEVDSDGLKNRLAGGQFRLIPSLSSGDPRTHAQKVLDAIEAVIEGRATQNQRNVTVGDKTIGYLSLRELLEAKLAYEDIVESERAEAEGLNRHAYYAEFSSP